MTRTSAGEIRLLCIGDARIETANGFIDPSANVLFATALYLILENARPISRNVLGEMLWPDASNESRMHRLRQTLLKLRRAGVLIDSVGKSFLRLAHRVNLEHEQFAHEEHHLEAASPATLLPLHGFDARISAEYEIWLDRKRDQIGATLVRAMLGRITKYRQTANWSAVEEAARSLLQMAPLNEEGTLALAESLAMRGSKHAATTILDTYISNTGATSRDLKVQASLMRRRIADRLESDGSGLPPESPLVGRAETMRQLTALLHSIKGGKGEAFLIQGDAGIGKSRILRELSHFSSLQGLSCIRINCRPSHTSRPLSAFVEAVPLLRSLPGAIGCAPENLQFLDRLTFHKPRTHDAIPDSAEPAWIFGAIQRALFDLLEAVADESPILIQFEDIHWLDDASADILAELVDRSFDGVIVGMTARSLPKIWDQLRHRTFRLSLEALTSQQAADLISNITGQRGQSMESACLDWCVRVAEGNPYFLTELATHWVDFHLDRDVPGSLAVVLDNRLSRLDRRSLQLLQTCALLENNATLDRIEAVLEYKPFQLLESIETLGDSAMITVERDNTGHGARLISKHELLSTAALQRLSAPGRRFLHRRIGHVLENEIDDHFSAAVLWDCAKHWQLAGDSQRALHLATSCASYLLKVGLPVEAASAYDKALTFCSTDQQRLDIYKSQTAVFFRMSGWSGVLETAAKVRSVEQRLQQARGDHDDIELMELRAQWQTFEWHAVLRRTIECLSEEAATPQHRAEAGVMALMLSGMQCDRRGSIAIYRSIEKLIAAGGVTKATELQARMVFNVDHGDINEGVAAAVRIVQDARTKGDMGEEFSGILNAAMACRVSGAFEEAENYYHDALRLATKHGSSFAEQRALPTFAHMALELGRVDQARELYSRLVALPAGASDKLRFIQQRAVGVRIALCDRHVEDASRLLPFSLDEIVADRIYSKRTYNLALLVSVDLALNGVASRDATGQLEQSFLKAKRTQHQAFSAFVLYVALRQQGSVTKAGRILGEYEAKYRREPWPAPRHLLETIEGVLPRDGALKARKIS